MPLIWRKNHDEIAPTPKHPNQSFGTQSMRVSGVVSVPLSQKILEILPLLSSILLRISHHLFNRKNKKNQIEKCIFIDKLKKVHLVDNNHKLRYFVPRYNLKQKYKILILRYNLKGEDYKRKA